MPVRATIPVLLAALVAAPSPALAGAWTLEQGKTKAFVGSSFTYGDHGFDANGNLIAVPEYRKFVLSATVEYGVRPWLTLFGRGEIRQEETIEEFSRDLVAPVAQTYGSVAAGARVRLVQTPAWVMSVEASVFSGGFDSSGIAAPSDGPAVEVRALAGTGRTLMGRPVFANAEAAYRAHLEPSDPDEVKFDLTFGVDVLPRWMVLAQTFSTFEVGGDDPGQEHKVGASIVRRVNERLRIELGGVATVYGENAIQEFGGRLSFWYDF
jgi:hypothetical protein